MEDSSAHHHLWHRVLHVTASYHQGSHPRPYPYRYLHCALTSARPLCQFSLVIAYNHKQSELRFLVFHAGGLTASCPLNLNQPNDHMDIICLILSTWKRAGDAGLPSW